MMVCGTYGTHGSVARCSFLGICILLVATVPDMRVSAKAKMYSTKWWPEETWTTKINFDDEDKIWWPPNGGYRITGRVSSVRAPWEPPMQHARYPTSILSNGATEDVTEKEDGGMVTSPQRVDYWSGTAAQTAFGNAMNTFECLKPGTAEYLAVSQRIIDTVIPERLKVLITFDNVGSSDKDDGGNTNVGNAAVIGMNKLRLQHTLDNGLSQLEIEFAGQRTREFPRGLVFVWPVVLGNTYYVTIRANLSYAAAAALFPTTPTEAFAKRDVTGSPAADALEDPVAVNIYVSATYGRDRNFSPMEFRVVPDPAGGNGVTHGKESWQLDPDSGGLRIMTFNVWNTNPPTWLYGSREERYTRYLQRMDHLCDVIIHERPAIVGFQEIRYDESLGGAGDHAQMGHLAARLPMYYFAFVPAMSYFRTNELRREEEGPAIASIYPIVHTEYLLLSRDLSDTDGDGHQRACLHAVIDVPHWGGLVDVFTVHLSLSERARDRSVREIWNMAANTSVARGVTQILLGDLNAEPQERAMKFFTGDAEIEGETGGFVDAWTAVHPEPVPRSNETHDIRSTLTFPSDKPTKRIDFIFVKGKGADAVKKTWLSGQDPVEGTVSKVDAALDTAEHLGMVHKDSPLWASDHRAVTTVIANEV